MNPLHRLARGALAGAVSPGVDQVSLSARFGHDPQDPHVRALSAVPQAVVIGLEHALRESDPESLHARLALVEEEQRGFAYEGATMAAVILDAMPRPTRGEQTVTEAVMTGPGLPHLFLNYIGIGFAMARLPRQAWSSVLPGDLPSKYHPALSWLAVDGYGFDLAYFHPQRYLRRQERPRTYPWLGRHEPYFAQAADQGVGRALWFAYAGRVTDVASAIDQFAPERRGDLWSGAGLAAAFAGQPDDLAGLAPAAGCFAPDLGVGAVLAAKARSTAEFVPSHTRDVLMATTGLELADATKLVDATEVDGPEEETAPHYATWRNRLRTRLEHDTSINVAT